MISRFVQRARSSTRIFERATVWNEHDIYFVLSLYLPMSIRPKQVGTGLPCLFVLTESSSSVSHPFGLLSSFHSTLRPAIRLRVETAFLSLMSRLIIFHGAMAWNGELEKICLVFDLLRRYARQAPPNTKIRPSRDLMLLGWLSHVVWWPHSCWFTA